MIVRERTANQQGHPSEPRPLTQSVKGRSQPLTRDERVRVQERQSRVARQGQASGSRHVWIGVVVVFVASASIESAGGQTIRILRVGVVTDEFVRVADVAEITGMDRASTEAIGNLRVVHSPTAGARRTVRRAQISAALKAGGVNFARVSLKGSTQCDVSRPARMPPAPKPEADRRSTGRVRLGPESSRHASQRTTLAEAMRAYLNHRLAEYGGEVVVSLPATLRDAMGLSTPEHNFRIRTTGSHRLGMVSLEVEVRRGGKLVQTLPVVAEVMLTKNVVVARRPVNRNAVIRTEDLTLAERTFKRVEDVAGSDAAALVGNRARRFVPVGEVVRARDVKPLMLIDRNDRVSITLRRGRLVIQTVAKARQAGSYGDVIEVLNEASRKNYFVRVTGPGTAEVTDAPLRKLAALN